jgi:hypothetical protein
MSITWFKLHHELPDDIKLRRFTPQEKWAWVALLCLASKGSDRGKIAADNDDIGEYCEFNCTQDWLYFRDKLIAKGMLEIDSDGNLSVLHWEERQYDRPSAKPDAVKARVAKHRAKKKAEKEVESNAGVTRGNADETIQIRLDPDPDQIRSDPEDLSLHSGSSAETEKGEVRESFEIATLAEPDPNPDPVAQTHSLPVQSVSTDQSAQQVGVNVPPPAAPAHDLFARRGMPHVVPIQAQFEGPWGKGYTDELKRFESWLRATKAKGKHDPSAWIGVVVDRIAKGGSRSLWDEFQRFESGEAEPAAQVKERSPAMKKFLGIA